MTIFHLHHCQGRGLYFFKLFTISLPLFCLLTWATSSTTTTTPPPPPPTSALSASGALENRGYSIFAALIAATANTHSWNGTGTVLAPPDFAFSFPAERFNNHHRPPPRRRPSASLLLRHTLQEPLTWHSLSARADSHELRTWHPNRCVFIVSKGLNGNLAISISPTVAVKIRRPDLFVDDHLTVHGVDGVLDPTSPPTWSSPNPTAQVEIESQKIDRSFLDHAVRALKRRGFGVVATAMAIKHSVLIRHKEITVFAPSDASLFSYSDGFRFDFLRHVVPERRHFAGIATGAVTETLSPNKSVVLRSENGDVTVNGVAVHRLGVYRNRWIAVLSVSRSIDDDASDSLGASQVDGDEILGRSPSPEAEEDAIADWRLSRGVSPATSNGGVSTLALAVEGEDLLCPARSRSLGESGVRTGVHVERSSPSISRDGFFEKLVQSGPSRGFNRDSELVVVSGPSDENQTVFGTW